MNWFPPDVTPTKSDKSSMATLGLPIAIERGELNQVKVLLGLGADPNASDVFGISIMSKALNLADGENKRRILIELLMQGGNLDRKAITDSNFWGKHGGKKILPGRTRKLRLKGVTGDTPKV